MWEEGICGLSTLWPGNWHFVGIEGKSSLAGSEEESPGVRDCGYHLAKAASHYLPFLRVSLIMCSWLMISICASCNFTMLIVITSAPMYVSIRWIMPSAEYMMCTVSGK